MTVASYSSSQSGIAGRHVLMLTILIHCEVHHLPGALAQRLDDGREAVAAAGLLGPVLGAAGAPVHPAMAPHRARPVDTNTQPVSEEGEERGVNNQIKQGFSSD